jgi:hypothetical protein
MRGMERCLIMACLSIVLALAIGCSKSIPPASATTKPANSGPVKVTDIKQLGKLVGQQIEIEGITSNGTGFAGIALKKYPLFLTNLPAWAPDQLDKKMKVTGVLVQKTVPMPGYQIGSPRFMIEEARWEDPTPPAPGSGGMAEGIQSAQELAKMLGQQVRVEGKAKNDQVGAAIWGNGISVYLYPAKRWHPPFAGKRVEVTGKLVQKPIVITPATATQPRKMGPAFFLERPTWKLLTPDPLPDRRTART